MGGLPHFRGSSRIARTLEHVRDSIPADVRGSGGVAAVKSGTALTINPAPHRGLTLGAQIQRFRVKSEEADYLVCHTWSPAGLDANSVAYGDGVEGDVDVYVAKPYVLRRIAFDGKSIIFPDPQTIGYTYSQHWQREADDGSSTETQVMTPRYFVDEELVAARGITGTTGVVALDSGVPVLVEYEDLNTVGRMWAKQ